MKTTKKRTAAEAYNEHTERARQNLKRIMEGLGAHIARTATTPAAPALRPLTGATWAT